jgi:hypothetical protein
MSHFLPGLGRPENFDARRYADFQRILRRFGDASAVMLKEQVNAAVRTGEDSAGFAVPSDRFARAAIRVALRQLLATDGPSAALSRWITLYDRAQSSAMDDDAEIH